MWDFICVPKDEGGLGLKKMVDWNRAAILRHIWSLFSRSRSLWVALLYSNLIRGRCFWLLKVPQDATSTWSKILKLSE